MALTSWSDCTLQKILKHLFKMHTPGQALQCLKLKLENLSLRAGNICMCCVVYCCCGELLLTKVKRFQNISHRSIKQFEPRSGPTVSGLIWLQTVYKIYQ